MLGAEVRCSRRDKTQQMLASTDATGSLGYEVTKALS